MRQDACQRGLFPEKDPEWKEVNRSCTQFSCRVNIDSYIPDAARTNTIYSQIQTTPERVVEKYSNCVHPFRLSLSIHPTKIKVANIDIGYNERLYS